MTCVMCHGAPGGFHGPVTREMICDSHWRDQIDAEAEIERKHPLGLDVHDGCGCITLDELKQRIGPLGRR